MATTSPKSENPNKTLTQKPQLQPSDPTNPTAHTPTTTIPLSPKPTHSKLTTPSTGSDESKATTGEVNPHIHKKMLRAERFGLPVQLSEEEKRNSRAERFGTVSSSHGSDALKKAEEQKRKGRAERFGLVQSVSADDEVKKKARLARFAPVSKTDSVEEEKRKARAIRFSQPSSGSQTQMNGKGNMETETAIAGKAGGEA